MTATGACPKCESLKVIAGARLRGETSLRVEVYESPDALIFKDAHSEALRVVICGECGYVELYAENPHELHLTHTRAQKLQG